MISRIWHGYTTFENADKYEALLKTRIFPYIESKNVAGYRKIELLKRELDDEAEFITIMLFDSMEDVILFAGKDYETAVVLPEAQHLLKRYDPKSQHYDIVASNSY